jgi:hypothetical protein
MRRRCGSPRFTLLIASSVAIIASFLKMRPATTVILERRTAANCIHELEALVSLKSAAPDSRGSQAALAGIQRAYLANRPLCLRSGGKRISVVMTDSGDSTLWGRSDHQSRTISLVTSTLAGQDQKWIEQIIAHELAHIALTEKIAPEMVPRWFAEGMANAVGRSVRCLDSATFTMDLSLRGHGSTSTQALRDWFVRRLLQEDRFMTESMASFIILKVGRANLNDFWHDAAERGFAESLQLFTKVDSEQLIRMWVDHVVREIARSTPRSDCPS